MAWMARAIICATLGIKMEVGDEAYEGMLVMLETVVHEGEEIAVPTVGPAAIRQVLGE